MKNAWTSSQNILLLTKNPSAPKVFDEPILQTRRSYSGLRVRRLSVQRSFPSLSNLWLNFFDLFKVRCASGCMGTSLYPLWDFHWEDLVAGSVPKLQLEDSTIFEQSCCHGLKSDIFSWMWGAFSTNHIKQHVKSAAFLEFFVSFYHTLNTLLTSQGKTNNASSTVSFQLSTRLDLSCWFFTRVARRFFQRIFSTFLHVVWGHAEADHGPQG